MKALWHWSLIERRLEAHGLNGTTPRWLWSNRCLTLKRRAVSTKTIVIALAAFIVVAAIGGYFLNGLRPEGRVTLVSSMFGTFPQGSNVTLVSGVFWVQNTGDKPIVLLTGTIPGLPSMSVSIPLSLAQTLYPNELGYFILNYKVTGDASEFASGTQHTLKMIAIFSDETTDSFEATFTSQECSEGSSYRLLTFWEGPPEAESNSGESNWTLTIGTNTTLPVVAVVVGVNNGTLWFPFELNGKPISPSNPLYAGTMVTQTFTWKNEANSSRNTQWVGECPDEGGTSSTPG